MTPNIHKPGEMETKKSHTPSQSKEAGRLVVFLAMMASACTQQNNILKKNELMSLTPEPDNSGEIMTENPYEKVPESNLSEPDNACLKSLEALAGAADATIKDGISCSTKHRLALGELAPLKGKVLQDCDEIRISKRFAAKIRNILAAVFTLTAKAKSACDEAPNPAEEH